jgi:hypothetical protein
MLHELRAGLFLGKDEADARFGLVKKRYPDLREFAEEGNSLFYRSEPRDDDPGGGTWHTSLLDALDLAGLLTPGGQG